MFIDLLQTARAFPLVPTGSLLQTNSLLGHELIAGPMVGDKQIVGHKEPGPGAYAESIDSVRLRYRITNVIPPVSNEHGWATWLRMVQQFGQPAAIEAGCS